MTQRYRIRKTEWEIEIPLTPILITLIMIAALIMFNTGDFTY